MRTIFGALMHLHEHGTDGEPIHAGKLLTQLSDHPARERVVELEERARTAGSPQALARDQELWLERRRHDQELAELRARLTESVHSFQGEEAAKDVLRNLHAKLRQRGVHDVKASRTVNH